MPNDSLSFLADLLASPELAQLSRVVETRHPDAAVLTATALARQARTLAVVVPTRALDACCRALGERLPATEVTAVRWGDGLVELGPAVVIDERVFFDGIAAEPFEALLPAFDHWLIAEGDGLVDRLRRALRTSTQDSRACGFLESRLGLGHAEGSTSFVSANQLRRTELACVPYLLRSDPNRVFYLQRTRRGRELRSDIISAGDAMASFLERSRVTVLGRALAVDGDLSFAMQELGLQADPHVDARAVREDLLLFAPHLPRYSEREWPTQVVDAARRVVGLAPEVTVLASAWNRDDLGRALRSQLSASVSIGHPAREVELSRVVVLDRVPLDVGEPAHTAQRERTARWFRTVGMPRAVQRFRLLASRVARGGAMVVLDGRMRSRWAEGFWRALPGAHTADWDAFRDWVSDDQGGVR
ncbi:MAG: hypothetical protein R3F61_32260 [Myxococcota bacterium]